MAKIEIEESEIANARQLQGVMSKIMGNPKAALLVEEARKMVDPEAPTPRLDQQKERDERLEALKKEFDEYRKSQEESSAKREQDGKLLELQRLIDTGNAKLREEGWTDEGLKALEEFRQKKGILDPLDAAGAYERQHGPQTAPVTPSSGIGRWDFTEIPEGQESYAKKLLDTRGESESLVMNEAMKALTDFRGPRR